MLLFFLDDYLRQKYGPDSYELVDTRYSASRKISAVQRFNAKDSTRSIFLLRTGAFGFNLKLKDEDTFMIVISIQQMIWNICEKFFTGLTGRSRFVDSTSILLLRRDRWSMPKTRSLHQTQNLKCKNLAATFEVECKAHFGVG